MFYMRALFQWCVLIFVLKQGESCDGNDWIQNDGNCYKIFTETVNKSVAESICLEHRSALASISNAAEYSFLVPQLSQTNTSEENFWIGLHKIENELIWNNRAPAGNLPWIDASVASGPTYRDCFIFNSARVLPFDCSATASFICEQWKVSKTHRVSCPPGTHRDLLSEKCFWYTHMPLSKAGAEVICSLKHGHSLIPRGPLFPINIGVLLMLSPPPQPIVLWTSLVVRNGSFLFEDGTEFSHEDFTLRRGDGECVALVGKKIGPYEMHQKPCSDEAIGFCESDMESFTFDFDEIFGTGSNPGSSNSSTPSCPVGNNWQEHDETGFCYWETSYETSKLSWEDARKYCQSYGGDLASIHSAEEERIGLGFQFGTIEHAYWIGLRYDEDTDNYVWVDGSPVNYTNWDDGQPYHADRRMRCGYMSSVKKKWMVSYCGMLSWFICKAPKQINPSSPVPPTREPLIKCPGSESEYFFNDYCYQKVSRLFGWHRAQQYCENRQSSLVSLHAESEVDFLIRLLVASDTSAGNRIWIGLNSLGLGGEFKWSDGSPVDFTNWDNGEPNNFQNQEKCTSSYKQHGMWNDENCNAVMNFVCKRRNGTSIAPPTTTAAPVVGNCQKGWYMFGDRCFQPFGLRKTQRKNWTDAGLHCLSLGGFLVSIRDIKDQALMVYLLQTVKTDTWIGLHDSIHSGVFYWLDNSPLFYTRWAPGEPSSHGFQEDCAIISYGDENAGRWKDTDCRRELPYICQTHRDPSITKPDDVRGTRCPHPPDYMKHGLSCYKIFTELKTWEEAQATCRNDGAYLVSISDMEKQAVVNYLAAKALSANETFWIGLKNTGKYPIQWENNFPMLFSQWGRNEPRIIPHQSASCYYSTISGYWSGSLCSEKKAFICHHTAEKLPTPAAKKMGSCPVDESSEWKAIGNSCMLFGMKTPIAWHSAKFQCATHASHLASFHSMEELNSVKYYLGSVITQPLFIGLGKNSEGGFRWTDNSPVDFVNWDEDEPQEIGFQCVQMSLDTMKWKVTGCISTKYFICAKERGNITSANSDSVTQDTTTKKGCIAITDSASSRKDTTTENGNTISTNSDSSRKATTTENGESRGLHPGVVAAIVFCTMILVAFAVVGIFRCRARKNEWNRYRVQSSEPIRSFENQNFSELNNTDIDDRNML